jgi:hypothetical protein
MHRQQSEPQALKRRTDFQRFTARINSCPSLFVLLRDSFSSLLDSAELNHCHLDAGFEDASY